MLLVNRGLQFDACLPLGGKFILQAADGAVDKSSGKNEGQGDCSDDDVRNDALFEVASVRKERFIPAFLVMVD